MPTAGILLTDSRTIERDYSTQKYKNFYKNSAVEVTS
jgi:hypothetical protein